MTSKPKVKTDEQRLWEWCGLEVEDNGYGQLCLRRVDVVISITLDNLFKYAVPKLGEVYIELDLTFTEDTGGRMCEVTVTTDFGKFPDYTRTFYCVRDYDPAQALMKAILKAIDDKN